MELGWNSAIFHVWSHSKQSLNGELWTNRRAMHRDVLKTLLGKKPFKPFVITVSSDDDFEVRHPEAAYLGQYFLAVAQVVAGEEDSRHAQMVWIDYAHIVSCEPIREIPF